MPKFLLITVTLLFATISASAQEAFDAKELKTLEGRWIHRFKNAAGAEFLAAKVMTGDRSEVTTYDSDGRTIRSHVSTVKVEKQGPVKTFSFFDLEVLIGPDRGFKQPAAQTYIYWTEGEHFVEAWGLLEGDKRKPEFVYWKREVEGAAPAAEPTARTL